MLIDKETYKLTDSNYIKGKYNKKRIVLGNTFNTDMKHVIGWRNRWFGEYTKTATYTIDVNGLIYEHFPPECHSNYFNDMSLNKSTISILLENEGWLLSDLFEKKLYVNYIGDIYKREGPVLEKKWRKYRFWAPYTEKQLGSAINLVKKLCEDYEIPLNVIGHNTNFSEVKNFNGVLYKSNFGKHYTDISPTWNFDKFKNKVEDNEKNE